MCVTCVLSYCSLNKFGNGKNGFATPMSTLNTPFESVAFCILGSLVSNSCSPSTLIMCRNNPGTPSTHENNPFKYQSISKLKLHCQRLGRHDRGASLELLASCHHWGHLTTWTKTLRLQLQLKNVLYCSDLEATLLHYLHGCWPVYIPTIAIAVQNLENGTSLGGLQPQSRALSFPWPWHRPPRPSRHPPRVHHPTRSPDRFLRIHRNRCFSRSFTAVRPVCHLLSSSQEALLVKGQAKEEYENA